MKKLKPFKPNRNNIETFLPIFTGFYGSHWDEPDFYGEAEHYGLPEDFPFYDYMNWSDYKTDLCKAFCGIVESEMSDYIERIEFQSLYSPREYNFTNDSINCLIRPKKQAIKDFIFDHETQFNQYLKDHLKSRDGFISSHSYDFTDWQTDTKNFTAFDKKNDSQGFNLGFILNFIAEQEQLTDCLVYADHLEVYPSNYYNESFEKIVSALDGIKDLDCIDIDQLNSDSDYTDKLPDIAGKVNEITKFIQENYVNPELESLVIGTYSEQDKCEYIDLTKLLKSVFGAIDNQTLKLELQ